MVQTLFKFRYLFLAAAFSAGTVFASTDSTATAAPSEFSGTLPMPDTARVADSANVETSNFASIAPADSQAGLPASDSISKIDDSAPTADSSKTEAKATIPEKQDSSNVAAKKIEEPKHPVRIGFIYEMARLHKADLNYEMTRGGKRYRLDVDVSDMMGAVGRYGLNQWISFIGILGYQKFDIGYEPAIKDTPEKRKKFSIQNVLLQLNAEVGFSFLELKNYQFRLLGFFGGTTGFSVIGDDYYMNTPLFGYTRGVALEINIHRVELLAGFRSSHIYFHTYRNNHRNEDDYSFMIDFDTMSSPFFSVGIGF